MSFKKARMICKHDIMVDMSHVVLFLAVNSSFCNATKGLSSPLYRILEVREINGPREHRDCRDTLWLFLFITSERRGFRISFVIEWLTDSKPLKESVGDEHNVVI